MGAESNTSYIAGMNFTNLVIAVPIIATILLISINLFRRSFAKHLSANILTLSCNWRFATIIIFIMISIYYANKSIWYSWFILLFIPLIFFATLLDKYFWQQAFLIESDLLNIYKNTSSIREFILTIKNKIETLDNKSNKGNILINGSWGSGKSFLVREYLIKLIPSVYLSCTDYVDLHELNTALIKKTNNCFIRFLMLLSLSRLIAIIGKTELKEYIGFNKVIIFDEFERLVDYNKIDPMHIVSLVQYLNSEKNCICILIANEDHLNNVSQFNNVREKLISSIYHYELSFDEAINIIQVKYLKTAKNDLEKVLRLENLWKALGFNSNNAVSKIETINDFNKMVINLNYKISQINQTNTNKSEILKIATIVNLNNVLFEKHNQYLQKWYNLDKNIRMIEHLYIKINQLYQATLQMIDEDDFFKENYTTDEQKNKLFTGLFAYIDTIIVQLYYLYLKSPQYLSQIEKLAIIYTNEIYTKDKETRITPVHLYIDKDSIQNLALKYESQHILVNKDNYLVVQSKINEALSTIIKDSFFENITQTIITEYLGKPEFVIKFLESNEYQNSFHNHIKTFMSKFNNLICESEHTDLIIKYFKQIDIFENAFLNEIENSSEKILNMDTISEYINFIQGSNNTETKKYNKVAYINALFIQNLESSSNASDALINEIVDYYKKQEKSKLITVSYKIIAQYAGDNNKIETFIQLVSQIVLMISEKYNSIDDYFIFLEFMNQSYYEIKNYLTPATIQICNENLIKLLTTNRNTEKFRSQLFMHLSNLNYGGQFVQNFDDNSLPILVNKIKEIYNTNELKQEFINTYTNHAWDIPKQVAERLQAELDAAVKSSNQTQKKPDEE